MELLRGVMSMREANFQSPSPTTNLKANVTPLTISINFMESECMSLNAGQRAHDIFLDCIIYNI